MTTELIIILTISLGVTAAVLIGFERSQRKGARRSERRRRFEINDEAGPSIPLRDPVDNPEPPDPSQEGAGEEIANPMYAAALLTPEDSSDSKIEPVGRFVINPDGEEDLITRPPFERRSAVLSRKNAAYVHSLVRKLPPWIMVCPRMRLDSLVMPTKPDGRDPEDWRTWRRRVRFRAVDLVLVDGRTFRPVLAMMIDRTDVDASKVGGGRDRIVDEVLTEAGIPIVRVVGRLEDDWTLIEPYASRVLNEIPSDSIEQGSGWQAGSRISGAAAVSLFAIDDQGDEPGGAGPSEP